MCTNDTTASVSHMLEDGCLGCLCFVVSHVKHGCIWLASITSLLLLGISHCESTAHVFLLKMDVRVVLFLLILTNETYTRNQGGTFLTYRAYICLMSLETSRGVSRASTILYSQQQCMANPILPKIMMNFQINRSGWNQNNRNLTFRGVWTTKCWTKYKWMEFPCTAAESIKW